MQRHILNAFTPGFLLGLDGTIRSARKQTKKGVIYTVTISPNSTASLKLLNSGTWQQLEAGTYTFKYSSKDSAVG